MDDLYDTEEHSLTYPIDLLSPDKHRRKPTILVNIGNDDPTRGDSAGRKGLAHAMAKKIDAGVIYADKDKMDALYPDIDGEETPYDDKLAKFLADQRPPDIVLGFGCSSAMKQIGKNDEQINYISEFNEILSDDLLGINNIVSHHLTDEMLIEEGKKFDKVYPNLKKPIIGVFLVDPSDQANREYFTKQMYDIASKYKEATIFLCGSRRTKPENYTKLKDTLDNVFRDPKDPSKNENITVTGFDFDRNADFNPYRGLIARGDHFVLWGNSMSMMSEPLIKGKTVHLFNTSFSDRKLREDNVVAYLSDCDEKKEFKTKAFPSINITEQLADKLLEQFQRKNKCTISKLEFQHREYPEEWKGHFVKLYYDADYMTEIPDDLRQNDDFIAAALQQNGMAYKHLSPDQQKNRHFVVTAIKNNSQVLGLTDSERRDNDGIMFKIINSHHQLYSQCSDRLKSCPRFSIELMENYVNIFKDMDKTLLEDRAVALQITKTLTHETDALPDKFLYDFNFVKEALSANPSCFRGLPIEIRDNMEIATVMLKGDPKMLPYAGKNVRGNKEFMLKALERNPYNCSYMTDELSKDRDFIIKAIQYSDVTTRMHSEFHKDKEIMLLCIERDVDAFYSCSQSLEQDTDICIAVAEKDPHMYSGFLYTMRMDTDVCVALLKTDIDSWSKVPEEKQIDQDFLLKCAEKGVINVSHIDERLYKYPDFIKKLTDIRPEWLDEPILIETLDNTPEIKIEPSKNDKVFVPLPENITDTWNKSHDISKTDEAKDIK